MMDSKERKTLSRQTERAPVPSASNHIFQKNRTHFYSNQYMAYGGPQRGVVQYTTSTSRREYHEYPEIGKNNGLCGSDGHFLNGL